MVDLDNKIKSYGDLSPEQISAIRKTIRLGRILQEDYPEIPELYRRGHSQKGIVGMLELQSKYNASESIIENAVGKALLGHTGGFDTKPYEGMIPTEERKKLAREHRRESGIMSGTIYGALGGNKLYSERKGIHAFSREERREASRKGGKILYAQRRGVHSMTSKELSEAGRKGGSIGGYKNYQEGAGIHGRIPEQRYQDALKGVMARGCTPWSKNEIEYAYSLSQLPRYQWGKGANKGKTNNTKIAETLNDVKHSGQNVRTTKAVEVALVRHRKSIEDIVVD